ncbi:MAG TPA: dienelactone hydrolase family protein [Thermoanaerobaculia bacterium]|nr:dienelactone hydrolase family protein [Thermoanaerobaculia bacterium]
MLVTTSYRDLPTPTGPMRTHIYAPVGQRAFPGLLLYPEIFQQTGPIARLSVQFASHGYVVMAPEIYHEHEPPGTVLGYDDAGKNKGNAYKKSTKLSTFDNDARVVIDALRGHAQCNGRIGTAGFCIGGHLAVRAALQPEVLACCSFYPTDLHSGTIGEGENADTLARVGELHGELTILWGRQDPHIPAEGRLAVYRALSQAGTRFSWHEVNGEHAFMRDEGARYDAEVARECMGIALGVFRRAL